LHAELSFECKNLANKDVLSKSDPQVCVEMETAQKSFKFIGKTEKVKDDLNPKFTQTVQLDYFFERVQRLRLTVWDIDANDKDAIGSIECNVGDIMGSRGVIERELVPAGTTKAKAGKIVRL
jgi:copine 1/2/3